VSIVPSPSSVGGVANDIMSQKVSVQKSGSISANFGYLGKQQPYIILERPELSIPVNYGRHEGYPANHKRKLLEVHGYTEIKADTLIANGFTGTSEELELLKQALQEGAYLE
jgi:esterase/lipase